MNIFQTIYNNTKIRCIFAVCICLWIAVMVQVMVTMAFEKERDITEAFAKEDNVDIRKYGSQGQQRTAALSLKLAEIEIVKKQIGDTPILLLDDVLSELDSSRQNYLLNSIHNIQTIMTCTGLDEFINNRFNVNRIFKVTNGKVSKEN